MVTQTQQWTEEEDIARRALELASELYTNKSIRPYEPALSEKIAGYNRLYRADLDIGRIRLLAASQSLRGDYGINRGGIDHLVDGLKERKIVAGVVVLTRRLVVVNKSLVTDVWEKIKDAHWLEGQGAFCWVGDDFCPVNRDRGYITDPDEPM